jgi:hypothetical protein
MCGKLRVVGRNFHSKLASQLKEDFIELYIAS